MCELFGMTCNKTVSVSFTWSGFLSRGRQNPDGWGVAFYPDDKSVCVIKEPSPSIDSPMAQFLKSRDFVKSRIVISHVRRASRGAPAYHNTHPFVRELFGREWVFAHNGTVIDKIPDPRFYEPIGETDSERAFCVMLDELRELGRNASLSERTEVIEKLAIMFSERGTFNFLMSDGEFIYAFWSGYNTLYYLVRAPPHHGRISLLADEDFRIDLSTLKEEDEVATIIATTRLTNENWNNFPCKALMVFKNGIPYLTQNQWLILKYIRSSPHKVSLRNISEYLHVDIKVIAEEILKLKKIGMVKQDSRDQVPADNPAATYYTNPQMRNTIDALLNYIAHSAHSG